MHYARNTFSKESTIFLQLSRDYFVTLNEENFIKTFPFVSDAIQTTSAAAAVNLMYTFGSWIVVNCLRQSCCRILSLVSGHLSWHNSPASGSAGQPGRHARDRLGSFLSTIDLANIYLYYIYISIYCVQARECGWAKGTFCRPRPSTSVQVAAGPIR